MIKTLESQTLIRVTWPIQCITLRLKPPLPLLLRRRHHQGAISFSLVCSTGISVLPLPTRPPRQNSCHLPQNEMNHGILNGIEMGEAFRFKTPSSIMIVGPSGCGKTCFTESLLLDLLEELFVNPLPTIHYCYGAWQDGFQDMKDAGVQFHEGVPTTFHLHKWFPKGGLLVLDDLMVEGGEDKELLDLFTKHSHHQNITVLYLCQDVFPPGKYAKCISRNAHYIVAFKNPRD